MVTNLYETRKGEFDHVVIETTGADYTDDLPRADVVG